MSKRLDRSGPFFFVTHNFFLTLLNFPILKYTKNYNRRAVQSGLQAEESTHQ